MSDFSSNVESREASNRIVFFCSFIIPSVIMALAFFTLGIYPGGKNMVMTYDLKALYLPLYGYISNSGSGFNNLFHSMSGGLGGNIYATIILCISPLDIIYSLVPTAYLPTALYFMVLLKIGLCGLSFCFYIRFNPKIKISAIMTVLLSCCYGLMSYNVMYFIAPMWYDCVFLLPILALLLEKNISGKKSPAFIVVMACCIIDDYYIAYMVIISLVIYFVFRVIEDGVKFTDFIRRTLTFFVHGVISAGISCFVLLPAVLDFSRGKLAEGEVATQGDLIKNTLLDVLLSLKSQNYAGLDFNASPNIFCGTVVVILSLIWFISFKRNIKARIAGLFVVAFYFASFIFGPLDRAWHGFRDPVCFSVRYAFTFSFFLILFAIRGLQCIGEKKLKISDANKSLVSIVICAYTLLELFSNSGYILGGIGTESSYTYSGEFDKFSDVYQKLITSNDALSDGTYGRIANTSRFSSFDGALFGYNGLSRFSSSYNYGVSELFRNLGFGTIYHSIGEKGITPPSISLFNTGYVISFMNDFSDYYVPVEEYNGFTLYRNEKTLPFAYSINDYNELKEFGKDPFENQNIVYDELFGNRDDVQSELYTIVPYSIVPDSDSLTDADDSVCVSEKYLFTSEKSGHYFLGVEYKYEDTDSRETHIENGYNDHVVIVRDYKLDGEKGSYGNGQYSFCVDLGYLNEGEEHELILQSSNDEIGEVWIYYYNEDVFEKYVSEVQGFDIKKIDGRGISLEGSATDETDVLITLPYEDGYKVYVDGELTGYRSYRDSLMVITVQGGTHNVIIKYTPPGLMIGMIISLLSVLIFSLYMYFIKPRKKY